MNDNTTTGVLKEVRARFGRWLVLVVTLSVIVALAFVSLAVVVLDAMLDLPEPVRATAFWFAVAAGVTVLGVGIHRWRRYSEIRIARWFERSDPSLGSRLTNAVQLAGETGIGPAGEYLRREAIALGRARAGGLNPWSLVRRAFALMSALGGAVFVLWLLLWFTSADLVQSVLPRFLDPHGDHPPYSRLKIAVSPGPLEVLYGGEADVHAHVSGRPVEKLWLVLKFGTHESRTTMFLAPDRSFFQTLANLREPAEYYITDGASRSRRFPVRIRYTPQIRLVEIATVFPEYTSRPARTNQLGNEAQALPEGTRVTLRVASNRPLQSGSLDLTPVLGGKPAAIVLRPDSMEGVVTGTFTLSEPVAFALSVRDVDGVACSEPRHGRFNILPDEKPRLYVLEPGRDAVATPEISVPVRAQASDDYGISRVVWLRGLNRSIERPLNMKLALKSGAQSVESTGAFELPKLGVRPGDVIEYYFEAADTYPKGPNLAFSRPFRLEIISREQFEAIVRQQMARKTLFEPYLKLDAWLRRLAERSHDLDVEVFKSQESARQQAQALADQLDEFGKELGKLLHNPAMFDLEQPFRTALVVEDARLAQTRAKLRQALGAGTLDPKQLRQVRDELDELAQYEEESVGEPAQQIASVVHVTAKADTFVRLAQQQAALAQMLRRYSDRTNALSRLEQVEVQEFAYQQDRVHEALQAYLKELPDLLAKIPADPEYDPLRKDVNQFLSAVAEAKIDADLRDAASALAEPDTSAGYLLAQGAAEKMDKLIAKCNAAGREAIDCLVAHFQPKLMKTGLAGAVEQILAALGVNQGVNGGKDGRDGYGMFNEEVALYGPNIELTGQPANGTGESGPGGSRRNETLAADASDPGLRETGTAGRVRLQPDAKFPLRYRELVGEYFRAIAETARETEK